MSIAACVRHASARFLVDRGDGGGSSTSPFGESASSGGAPTATGVVRSGGVVSLAGDQHPPPQLDHRLSPWWCGWPPQGLPQLDNVAAAALSCFDSAHGQSVSVAASSIIMASRFLASSSCRLAISAILRSR